MMVFVPIRLKIALKEKVPEERSLDVSRSVWSDSTRIVALFSVVANHSVQYFLDSFLIAVKVDFAVFVRRVIRPLKVVVLQVNLHILCACAQQGRTCPYSVACGVLLAGIRLLHHCIRLKSLKQVN